MTIHCMLDLETAGNGPNAAILSIGAAKFDPMFQVVPQDGLAIVDSFEVRVDLSTAIAAGGVVDGSTIDWWMSRDRDQARVDLTSLPKVDIWSALNGFVEWLGADMPVWGNGATFDNVIIRTACARASIEYPVKFWNDRCFRTIKNLAPEVKRPQIAEHATAHNALSDAITQAVHLQHIVKHLGLVL